MGSYDYYRDYDRRREERRDYFRREDLRRETRERDFWKEHDRRAEHARTDREYERRRREEEHTRAREAIRRGHTADAIRHLMGPEYAIRYLEGLAAGSSAASDNTSSSRRAELELIRHSFVRELPELVENVESTPPGTTFEAKRIDQDGDAVVSATLGEASETFWVQEPLLSRLHVWLLTSPRAVDVATKICAVRDAHRGVPTIWSFLNARQ